MIRIYEIKSKEKHVFMDTNKFKYKFVNPMLDIKVIKIFQILAFPYPSIEWQKDGRTCVEGAQYSIENGPNYTTLILKSTAKTDKGKYTLMLTNKHGDDRATVAMNISDRPDA